MLTLTQCLSVFLYNYCRNSFYTLYVVGITVTPVRWWMVLECVQCVLKFATRTMTSPTPSLGHSSVTAGQRRMAAARFVKLNRMKKNSF